MRTETPTTIYLSQYTPPAWWVDTVDLVIAIHDDHAVVTANLHVRRNADVPAAALWLDGEALQLVSVAVDGAALLPSAYAVSDKGLSIALTGDAAHLSTVVRIEPDKNTALSGLYRSKDGYFTQCEAEGFRRITYYPDRPDVMARFTCRLEADQTRFPVLLANGNPVDAGELPGGRHWALWQDPFAKPAYLFACVAAKLDVLEDHFVTASGRRVRCAVYVEPGKLDQCGHALEALKLSMAWDEERFGLEMDLDHYMIVAVGDFNMGAMENKGLNIFNTKYVLARPDVATDTDYQNIDRVVAHEYFHNWTGNRVTCRDWFQLSLKEGLTVFRDQEFGMDVHSRAVTRIQEVRTLRAAQFPEDAGPMAHPIRPAAYQEINNFYTATVYEKGAEVIRMIHTLIGEDAFRAGMDEYFRRHDGQAVTCDDFVAAMEAASGRDLGQFRRWYRQAGTPALAVSGHYDAATRRYTLHVEQRYPETAYEQRLRAEGLSVDRGPYHLPLSVGLLAASHGRELAATRVLELREDRQSFVFEDVAEAPVPSLLRGFSAPVVLQMDWSVEQLTLLMAHDNDPVARWDAGQELATRLILEGARRLVGSVAGGAAAAAGLNGACPDWIPAAYIDAIGRLLDSAFTPDGDPAFVAEALALPSEAVLAEQMSPADPEAIHQARQALRAALAHALHDRLVSAYERLTVRETYRPDAEQAGRRALRNACLALAAETGDDADLARAQAQFDAGGNMTDTYAALSVLANSASPARDPALAAFYERWCDEALVVDKWLGVQATSRQADTPARVRGLLQHPGFDIRNPNKVYALVRAFCAANPRHFHAADGAGYALGADLVLQLDALNPQVASRVARCFDRWRRYDQARQALARAQLERIKAEARSPDVLEVVGKSLGG
ncbi:MAG: aminopeptidase N [Rhodocyclaceae bacterium]|nr:aminopeptidase N [Rhodocyclaceae bacterium]